MPEWRMTRTVKADHAAKKTQKYFRCTSSYIVVHVCTVSHFGTGTSMTSSNDVQYINIKNFDFLLLVSTNTINNKEKEIHTYINTYNNCV